MANTQLSSLVAAAVLGALGEYFRRASNDVEGTPGARWIAAVFDYSQLKTRFGTQRTVEVKFKLLAFLAFAFSLRALWSAWQA